MKISATTICTGALFVFFISALAAVFGCSDELPIQDGSYWELVNEPGFGNTSNYGITAMAGYQGCLYAMTRNENQGAEVWRYCNEDWQQVLFPGGETNGIYGNPYINNLWGAMVEFQGKLYFGFSSGVQGELKNSTGCEIWRYDGSQWEPVVSNKKYTEETGILTSISGCEDNDADRSARFTDSAKNWVENQFKGDILTITSGEGIFRQFIILGNSSDTLIVQQDEFSGKEEFTVCAARKMTNPFPPYDVILGRVEAGDAYEITTGYHQNGFGQPWNKMITDMVVFNDKLYVATGLNYQYGAQVWFTKDGEHWNLTYPEASFGLFHHDETYPNGRKPVSSSISCLTLSDVSGELLLYAGGTGSSGDKGSCSRLARLIDNQWELVVDSGDPGSGRTENGFGDGMNCSMFNGNFLPSSLVQFNDKLFAGVQSLAGTRVLYSLTGSPYDKWVYSIGGDSTLPAGFDGKRNPGALFLMHQNVATNLFVFNETLYAGGYAMYAPKIGATQRFLTGAHLWKSKDGIDWKPVTQNGFGDAHIISFEAFTIYQDTLFVAANKGCIDCPEGLDPEEGGLVFKLVQEGS